MEIVVPPPAQVTWFLVGLPVVVLVVMLFLRGKPLVHRVVPVLLVAAASFAVWHFALKPMRFSWDEKGIRDETFGPARTIGWGDVRGVRLLSGFNGTEFRPVRRTNGTYFSGWCSGTWQVANGTSLRVFIEPGSADALLVTTGDGTYLYAPRSFGSFAEAVRRGVGRQTLQ